MAAFVQREVSFDACIPLRLLQIFLYLNIGTEFQRSFPATDGVAVPIGSILSISQDGQRVGGIGCNPYRTFRVRQSLNRVSGSQQQCDVIVENRRILTFEAEGGFEEGSSLAKIRFLHLVFSGDEISRSGHPRIALLLQGGERISIDLAVMDNLVTEFRFALQVVGRGK